MRPLNVLVVDDDPDLAESLEVLLRLESMGVELAASGEGGLDRFRAAKFDICIVDVKLPGMSGLECLREILAIGPGAKVMMMTAYGDQKTRDDALGAGAMDLLYKPLEVDEVLFRLGLVQREIFDGDEAR